MFKRPMVSATILFVAGVFLSAYESSLLVIALLGIAVCVFAYKKTKRPFLSLLTVIVILSGVFRMELAKDWQDKVTAGHSGRKATMRLTAMEFSEDSSVTACLKDGDKVHKVYLSSEENIEVSPGDIIEGEITLRTPLKSKIRFPGQKESFAGNNIFLTATAEKITVTGERESGFSGLVHSMRVYMDKLGEKAFSGNDRAFFNAMIFGDKRFISDEMYVALQASGLNHIAVVSGMHLSVAIAFMTFLARKLFGKKRIGYFFILAGAFLLTLITGAGASVIRAFIMCCLYLLSKILYRDTDSPTSLAFAAFVMIMGNPFMIFNVGFILSVLSVMGIFLFNGKILAFFKKLMPIKLAQVLALSISAQLTVIPVAVYYFGTLAPYSLLSNALLVPVSGLYVILGMIYVLLSPISFLLPAIEIWMKLISQMITAVCFRIQEFNFSLIEISDSFTTFASVWVFLAVVIYLYPLSGKKRRILASIFALIVLWIHLSPEKNGATVYTLPYGRNTMTVLQMQGEESLLIDCPDLYDAQYLENPESPFYTVVITNTSVGQVFKWKSNIRTVIVPDNIYKENAREKLLQNAKELSIHVVFMDDFKKFQVGDAVLEYIAVENEENARGVKIEYDLETLLSFQGFRGNDISEMGKRDACYEADYLILPFSAYDYNENIFRGKLLRFDTK